MLPDSPAFIAPLPHSHNDLLSGLRAPPRSPFVATGLADIEPDMKIFLRAPGRNPDAVLCLRVIHERAPSLQMQTAIAISLIPDIGIEAGRAVTPGPLRKPVLDLINQQCPNQLQSDAPAWVSQPTSEPANIGYLVPGTDAERTSPDLLLARVRRAVAPFAHDLVESLGDGIVQHRRPSRALRPRAETVEGLTTPNAVANELIRTRRQYPELHIGVHLNRSEWHEIFNTWQLRAKECTTSAGRAQSVADFSKALNGFQKLSQSEREALTTGFSQHAQAILIAAMPSKRVTPAPKTDRAPVGDLVSLDEVRAKIELVRQNNAAGQSFSEADLARVANMWHSMAKLSMTPAIVDVLCKKFAEAIKRDPAMRHMPEDERDAFLIGFVIHAQEILDRAANLRPEAA